MNDTMYEGSWGWGAVRTVEGDVWGAGGLVLGLDLAVVFSSPLEDVGQELERAARGLLLLAA